MADGEAWAGTLARNPLEVKTDMAQIANTQRRVPNNTAFLARNGPCKDTCRHASQAPANNQCRGYKRDVKTHWNTAAYSLSCFLLQHRCGAPWGEGEVQHAWQGPGCSDTRGGKHKGQIKSLWRLGRRLKGRLRMGEQGGGARATTMGYSGGTATYMCIDDCLVSAHILQVHILQVCTCCTCVSMGARGQRVRER